MKNRRFRILGIAALLLVVLTIVFFRFFEDDYRWWRKFGVVREGVLLRGPQPTASQIEHLQRRYGIKTTLSLVHWDDIKDRPDCAAEGELAARSGIRFIHMPLSVPRSEQIREFLEIVDNPENCPVFLHCLAGTARTGLLAAVFRMERDGWSNQEAFDEMLTYNFIPDNPEHKEMVDFVLGYRRMGPGQSGVPAGSACRAREKDGTKRQ